jgi:hypothetical protein
MSRKLSPRKSRTCKPRRIFFEGSGARWNRRPPIGRFSFSYQDHCTGNNVYPLNTPHFMTLDWNITTNLANSEEAKLHLQGREQWYPDQQVNTGYGAYLMQGACDPEAAPGDLGYYPDCSEKNNNLRDGGVVAPSDTNYYLSQKAKDIVFVPKALFESVPRAKQVGVYFANGGARSYVKFPSRLHDGRTMCI